MRIAIIGWPGTGKTTLANELGGGRSTDDLMHLEWSKASEAASYWFDEPGPWIYEGVAIPRALRKWRERNPDKLPPIDKVILMTHKYRDLQSGAITMGKGIDKVLGELWTWLKKVEIEIRPDEEDAR
jgi:dephospho-CoA kinase